MPKPPILHNKKYSVCVITNYATASNWKRINKREYHDLEGMVKALEEDKGYHFVFFDNIDYIFVADVDGFNGFHVTIPKLNCNIKKQKEIATNISKVYKNENPNSNKSLLDLSIYGDNKLFRCPNQTKPPDPIKNPDELGLIHKVKKGKLENFILDNIPENSENINDCVCKNMTNCESFSKGKKSYSKEKTNKKSKFVKKNNEKSYSDEKSYDDNIETSEDSDSEMDRSYKTNVKTDIKKTRKIKKNSDSADVVDKKNKTIRRKTKKTKKTRLL